MLRYHLSKEKGDRAAIAEEQGFPERKSREVQG